MRGTRRRISQTSRGEKVAACVAETMLVCGSVLSCVIQCLESFRLAPAGAVFRCP